jgi:hypothetical protein
MDGIAMAAWRETRRRCVCVRRLSVAVGALVWPRATCNPSVERHVLCSPLNPNYAAIRNASGSSPRDAPFLWPPHCWAAALHRAAAGTSARPGRTTHACHPRSHHARPSITCPPQRSPLPAPSPCRALAQPRSLHSGARATAFYHCRTTGALPVHNPPPCTPTHKQPLELASNPQ